MFNVLLINVKNIYSLRFELIFTINLNLKQICLEIAWKMNENTWKVISNVKQKVLKTLKMFEKVIENIFWKHMWENILLLQWFI